MANKPLWKEAIELREEYNKRGIEYCYNQRNKYVYLSLLNAPTVAIGNYNGCQLTGHLIIYGGVTATRDIEKCIEDVKRNYTTAWKENGNMLKFIETIN
jgi:hypothetical protein